MHENENSCKRTYTFRPSKSVFACAHMLLAPVLRGVFTFCMKDSEGYMRNLGLF
jgi:hypothetical protein